MRKPFSTASIGAMKLYLAMSSIEGVVPYFRVKAALWRSESEEGRRRGQVVRHAEAVNAGEPREVVLDVLEKRAVGHVALAHRRIGVRREDEDLERHLHVMLWQTMTVVRRISPLRGST